MTCVFSMQPHSLHPVASPTSGFSKRMLSHNLALVDFHSVIVFDPGVGEGQGNVSLVSRPHFSCPLEKWVW